MRPGEAASPPAGFPARRCEGYAWAWMRSPTSSATPRATRCSGWPHCCVILPPRLLSAAAAPRSFFPSLGLTPRPAVAWRSCPEPLPPSPRRMIPQLRAKAADVIAALASMRPTHADAGWFGRICSWRWSGASLDALSVARVAGFDSPMGMVMLSRAEKLCCRAVELAQVIDCPSGRGHRSKIVIEDHIRDA